MMSKDTETQMEAAIEHALRGGNIEDAARVVMSFRNCTLDAGRAEIHQRLKQRMKH
jgi:hypothetical protein